MPVSSRIATTLGEQVGLAELAGRQVHPARSSGSIRECRRCHADLLAARLAQHPQADVEDEPGLLGQVDELGGRQQPSVGVLPPHQRLGADDPARRHLDLGLVVDRELAVLDGLAQLDLVLQPAAHLGPQRLVEDLDAVAAQLLGRVHGRVGVAQQVVGRLVGVGGEGDAHAGRRRRPPGPRP